MRRAAAVCALLVATACSGSRPSTGLPTGAWGRVSAEVNLGITAGTPVYGDGYLWVPDIDHGALWKIDPQTNRPIAHIPIGNRQALLAQHCGPATVHAYPNGSFWIRACDLPPAVALTPGSVWVIRTDNDSVVRLDPRSDRVLATIPIGVPGWDLVADATDVWVTSYFDDALVHIDATSSRVVAVLPNFADGPTGLALDSGYVWVASSRSAELVKVDANTNRIVDVIPVLRGPLYTLARPLAVAVAFGSVWTRLEYDFQVVRVDPATDKVVERIAAPSFQGKDGLDHFAVGPTRIWVSGLNVDEIDPSRNEVVRRLPLTGMTVNYGAGSLWALNLGGPLYRITPDAS